MLLGIPWILPTISMKSWATPCAVCCAGNMPRWIPFEKWSTTTKMQVWPLYTSNPTMKSIDKASHGWDGTGKGQSKPFGFAVSYLTSWQSTQLATNFRVSMAMSFHMKFSNKWFKDFLKPIWPPVGVWWNSVSKTLMKEQLAGNHMRPRCRIKWDVITWSGKSNGDERICSLTEMNSSCDWCSLYKSSKNKKYGVERMKKEAVDGSATLDRASATTLVLPYRYYME